MFDEFVVCIGECGYVMNSLCFVLCYVDIDMDGGLIVKCMFDCGDMSDVYFLVFCVDF